MIPVAKITVLVESTQNLLFSSNELSWEQIHIFYSILEFIT